MLLPQDVSTLTVSSESTFVPSPDNFFRVFWGGPDYPPRRLRDLLKERIDAVPSGGEILWATYYFRDEGLAAALLQASRRGVKVRVVLEGKPRTERVNRSVLKLLKGDAGLGDGLRVLCHNMLGIRFRRSRLHEKLYYFSHPAPHVLVGTFNPSGNFPEDPNIISEIGDQDRGHNVLVEVADPVLVRELFSHAQRLFCSMHGPWESFLPASNRVICSGKTRILFFPRWRGKEFYRLFSGLGDGSRLRIVVSHLNDPGICKHLFLLKRQGVIVEIITHDTKRRVPSWVENEMLRNGVIFKRYIHPEGLPMHNKFMLIDAPDRQVVTFGSLNLSVRSLHTNHELLVINETPDLYQSFSRRWDEMSREINP
jgi:phosphatidylserine/phosphatidylglycerophosphate/cardiolipin synthase-like enzyme